MAASEQHAVSAISHPSLSSSLTSRRHSLNGTDLGVGGLGHNPIGQITYDPNGYMSVGMISTTPGDIPPPRTPDKPTYDDFAKVGEHILAYAGELHIAWDNSTVTSGRLYHGPLMMSSRTSWLGTNQTRNYDVTMNATETGGRDVLHLWLRNETSDQVANLFWARAPPT